ncbi:hypothetical protein E2C01_081342 [Portunus trituberculatus]|uniref:Uncharacterized protein n=1 Tax=Portunus trituberculatus TaxID=210409 RepID=A0A5B7IRP7_PORTR|nr:hypothetical protein [Portunus trituberculatus]
MEEKEAEGRCISSFLTCPSHQNEKKEEEEETRERQGGWGVSARYRQRERVAGGRGRKEGSRVTADSVQTSVKVGGVASLRLLTVTRYLFAAKV